MPTCEVIDDVESRQKIGNTWARFTTFVAHIAAKRGVSKTVNIDAPWCDSTLLLRAQMIG